MKKSMHRIQLCADAEQFLDFFYKGSVSNASRFLW